MRKNFLGMPSLSLLFWLLNANWQHQKHGKRDINHDVILTGISQKRNHSPKLKRKNECFFTKCGKPQMIFFRSNTAGASPYFDCSMRYEQQQNHYRSNFCKK